jgi:hypothetical protein
MDESATCRGPGALRFRHPRFDANQPDVYPGAVLAPSEGRVRGLLWFLVLFDATLVTVAMGFPGLWFTVFHGTAYDDPEGFLRRCGANWAAFFLLQAIALVRWKRDPVWLAVVAGARLGDVFTDVTYVLFARDATLFAKLTLPPMLVCNALFGLFLLRAYRSWVAPGGRGAGERP